MSDLRTAGEVAGPAPATPPAPARTGLVLASRGDALTPSLFAEVERRYPVLTRTHTDLTPWQRGLVAATTFRPTRTRWAEAFFKSPLGYRLRSRNATRAHRAHPAAPVLQVHALFEVVGARSLLYVDCTHRQSAQLWPAWNPLRGKALDAWYAREGRAYRSAEHVFAFSEATRRSLVEDYAVDPAAVTVVGAGINVGLEPAGARTPGADLPAARRSRETTTRAPRLLLVGNDFERKGGHVVTEAFRAVRERHPGARLDLVGTRPVVAPQPGVHVHGRITDRTRLADLFSRADVFVVPSYFDPFPLVLLEAMSLGVPVVSSTSCGIPEMVRDGVEGTLVPAGDVAATATALLDLLADPERARSMAAAARERVFAEFTWERVVDRMAPALDRALDRAPRA